MTRDDLSFLMNGLNSLQDQANEKARMALEADKLSKEFALQNRKIATDEAQRAFENKKLDLSNFIAGAQMAAKMNPTYKGNTAKYLIDLSKTATDPEIRQKAKEATVAFAFGSFPETADTTQDNTGGVFGDTRLGKFANAVNPLNYGLDMRALKWLFSEPGK